MGKKQKPPDSEKKLLKTYARYSGIAFQMIAIILAGVYAGIWLDEKIPLKFPLFKLVFSLLSVGLAMYAVIRGVTKDN